MKPVIKSDQDPLFMEMDKSWKAIPPELLKTMACIPANQKHQEVRRFEYVIIFLNSILIAWGLGVIYQFKSTITYVLERYINHPIGDLGSHAFELINHPLFVIVIIAGFGITWLSYDLGDT